jgi:mono/diheme cytochrome c family protein
MMRRSISFAILFAAAVVGCKQKTEGGASQAREMFVNTCSRCHGADGTGGPPAFEGGPSPRNFHDHDFHQSRTDEQLKQTIKTGKGSGMPAFAGMFDDAQLTLLVGHIRSLDDKK